jgi:lipopolysaccharide biosynthesis regulator YciM
MQLLPLAMGVLAAGALCALILALFRKWRSEDEARAYLAGFRYVLSDDADAAVAELSKAAQLNTQTLETYFALGELFRRKGELDRAIRLHCNILLRSNIGREVRTKAQLALAMDYKGAGLKDKAEAVLERVLSEEPHCRQALIRRRQLYEEQGDWAGAIDAQRRLMAFESGGERVLANLLAQLSRQTVAEDAQRAEALAERAVHLWPECANAQLALSAARTAVGKRLLAIQSLRAALALEPELAPSSVARIAELSHDDSEIESFWQELLACRPGAPPLRLALAQDRWRRGKWDDALTELRDLVRRWPQFWDARRELMAALLAAGRFEELRADYGEILGAPGSRAAEFLCSVCRQKLPEHLFRCPTCDSWGSIRRERELSSLREFDGRGARA